ncbi:T0183262 isoform 1, partial [Pongo abelii]
PASSAAGAARPAAFSAAAEGTPRRSIRCW